MLRYLLRRGAAMALALGGASVLVFLLVRAIPGTVVEELLGQGTLVSPETVRALREFFGLDRPLAVQFADWFGRVLRGDLGTSWRSDRPVLWLLAGSLPVTAELAALAVLVALVVGIPLGMLSGSRPRSALDSVVRVGSTLALSVPAFWQGAVSILLASLYLNWTPSLQWIPLTRDPLANLTLMALPSLTLGTATAAMVARMTRSSLLDVLGQDYIRTARAKGVAESRVLRHHALRNALIPVVTVVGVQAGYLLGGIVVVEDVFSLPGVGRLLLDALFQRDYPVVQGTILVLAALFMLVNLGADLLYALVDPRIHYG